MSQGIVVLVGAGPGDPSLITEAGLRHLARADVVLYDTLAQHLIARARPDAELVFAGKRAGAPSERQSDINARLIAEAKQGRYVVRLKGGDPFMFGRAVEELEALRDANVPFIVVPGVTAPLAAASYAGLALTDRELSSSVAFVTASESPEKNASSHDWSRLATATDTLVVFMGVRRLSNIMELLMQHGRDGDTPAAIVTRASTPQQRTYVGTVKTIGAIAEANDVQMPALTVIGNIVTKRESLTWFEAQPLFGKRILVTRPRAQAASLIEALQSRGAHVETKPLIRIEPPSDPSMFAHVLERLEQYDWIVLTSANGVDALFNALYARSLDARALGNARVCVIGPATRETLRERGIVADLMPEEFRGEAVAAALLASGAPQRVLLARAEVARDALPDALRAAGVHVDVVPVYKTVGDDQTLDQAALDALDVVTFTSPSTVREFVKAVDGLSVQHLVLAAIGPVTADEISRAGWVPTIVANEYTSTGLVQALHDHFAKEQS